jgi:NAD(P)-dependent dehydrogenase (short-subunit alcohol dehydrogenase family)
VTWRASIDERAGQVKVERRPFPREARCGTLILEGDAMSDAPALQRFTDRTALVTGAASGIGAATVRRLVAEGARVVATDVAEKGLASLAKTLGNAIVTMRHDVTREDEWHGAVALAQQTFGGLHGLLNAAGILARGTIEDTSHSDWRRMMDVNVYGTFLGCRHAMPAIQASGGGAIVNISSVAGLEGSPDILAYGASKGAVRSMTKSIALEGARRDPQVRCNSIHPGVIATPMVWDHFKAYDDPKAAEAAWRGFQPAGEIGAAEDVAAMIAFLLADESSFVTGAEYVVDGAGTA